MKKNNILFLIPLLLICSGFTTDYNLKIKNDKFIEDIILNFEDGEMDEIKKTYEEYEDGDFPELGVIYNSVYAVSPDKIYTKEISSDYKKITLNSKYSYSEFEKADYINSCFENAEIINDRTSFEVKLSGSFSCSGLGVSEIKLENINNKVKILDKNVTKSHGKYVWKISEDDNDIHFKVSKRNSFLEMIIFVGIFGLLSAILFIIFRRKSINVNKI